MPTSPPKIRPPKYRLNETTGRAVVTLTPQRSTMEYKGIRRKIAIGQQAQEIVRKWMKPDLQAYIFDPRHAIEHRAEKFKKHRRRGQAPSPRKSPRTVGGAMTRIPIAAP